MKKFFKIGIALFLFTLVFTSNSNYCFGEIYKYKDKDGVWCFTDDISTVPDLSKAKTEKEYRYYEPKENFQKRVPKSFAPKNEIVNPQGTSQKLPHRKSSFLSNIWDKIDGKESIRKKINQIENKLEVIQKEINRVIRWRAKKLGDLHTDRSLISSRVLLGHLKEDEENINAEATVQLDKLTNERDFLQKKLLLLQDKL